MKKRFILAASILTVIAIIDWYDQVYCKNVAVPTKCAEYQYPWE